MNNVSVLREKDLIFADRLRFAKNRSREQFGVNTTEPTFDSRKLEPRIILNFQVWPDSRKFEPGKIKSFTVFI
ncbi:MAG: hypothetical protein PV344_08055 [Anaplasma sp.]|nr:hypothetical protein [Anaplasma sp.]